MSDLVNPLRSILRRESALRIEALEAERDALRAAMDEAADEIERLRRREVFLMQQLNYHELGQDRGKPSSKGD